MDANDKQREILLAAMGRRTLERVLENAQQLVAKGGNPLLVKQAQERLDKFQAEMDKVNQP